MRASNPKVAVARLGCSRDPCGRAQVERWDVRGDSLNIWGDSLNIWGDSPFRPFPSSNSLVFVARFGGSGHVLVPASLRPLVMGNRIGLFFDGVEERPHFGCDALLFEVVDVMAACQLDDACFPAMPNTKSPSMPIRFWRNPAFIRLRGLEPLYLLLAKPAYQNLRQQRSFMNARSFSDAVPS